MAEQIETPKRRQADLMAHLAEQYTEYKENILPLYPADDADGETSDNSFENFDSEKNEFLENLWDVIQQHFDDLQNGDGDNGDGETQETSMFENRIG